MATLNKQALIERLFEHNTFETKKAAGEALDIVLNSIIETIEAGDEVYLGQTFGGFKPAVTAARSGVAMGVKYSTPAKKSIKFKPSTKLKARLNEPIF